MNEILKEELIYEGRICKLTVDEVTFADGSKGLRDVFHLPGAVAILPLLDDQTVLLVSQYRHAVQEELLELPAGMLEKGEDPLNAAARELAEETGYASDDIEFLCDFYTSPGVVKEKIYVYAARNLHFVGQNLDDDEYLNVHRVAISELEEKIRKNQIKDGKTVLGYLFWKNKK